MDTTLLWSALLVMLAVTLRWLGARQAAHRERDVQHSEDAHVIICKSDADLPLFTGKPVAPSDTSLMRKFKEWDDAEISHYTRRRRFAGD